MTAIFQLGADAKTIAHVLRGVKVGETVTYSELSKAIARDVRTDARGCLDSARRIVQREDRMIFDAVRGEGVQRLDDVQIVGLGDRARDHIRRTSRRAAKALTCVDYDGMKREHQIRHNTALSMLGVLGELASDKSTRRLSAQVESAGDVLPAAKASIAAFGSII